MSLKEKRIRSINWDEEEKQLFRSVFIEFATTIENKSLNNNVNKLKTKAWEEVHNRFNELNGRYRSLNQLKVQWKTMKINARKQTSLFKREINKTGGGGRPQTPGNDIIEINDLINAGELIRDQNIYDSDGIITTASTSRELSASETCTFTLQDITEDIVETNLAECENIHLEKQESTSVVTVVEEHIPTASKESKHCEPSVSQESIASMILKDNAADNKTQDNNNMEAITPKNITGTKQAFRHKKKLIKSSQSPSCSAKRNNYIQTMVNHSQTLKDEEHKKRMEILEMELNIQKEKFKCVVLEREILEIRKAKEL